HPRAHFHGDVERYGHGHQGPQQRVPVSASRLRVRGDTARVVVHVRRDDSRPDHRQEQRDAMPKLVAARKKRQRASAYPIDQIVDCSEVQTHLLTSRDTTSSTVTVPMGRFSSSITVSMRRLYLSNNSNTSFSCASGVMLTNGSVFKSFISCSGAASSMR